MERKCPNCGKALPEEAAFCLFCFTDVENFKKSELRPVVTESKSGSFGATFFDILKTKLTKKSFVVLVFLRLFCLLWESAFSP